MSGIDLNKPCVITEQSSPKLARNRDSNTLDSRLMNYLQMTDLTVETTNSTYETKRRPQSSLALKNNRVYSLRAKRHSEAISRDRNKAKQMATI